MVVDAKVQANGVSHGKLKRLVPDRMQGGWVRLVAAAGIEHSSVSGRRSTVNFNQKKLARGWAYPI